MEVERDQIAKAFNAMRRLGIDIQTVKPVLKRLLKLYNWNWELIEEDNFRTLADAIFENADNKLMADKNSDMVNENVESTLKKQRLGTLKDNALSAGHKEQTVESSKEVRVSKTSSGTRMVESTSASRGRVLGGTKHKNLTQTNSAPNEEKSLTRPASSAIENSKEVRVPKTSSGTRMAELNSVSRDCTVGTTKHKNLIQTNSAPIEEKSFTRLASSAIGVKHEHDDPDIGPKVRGKEVDHDDQNAIVPGKKQSSDHSAPPGFPLSRVIPGYGHQTMTQITYDIASSTNGLAKVSLTCDHAVQHNLLIPRVDEVLALAEHRFQKSCETFRTHFSLVKMLNGLCEGFLEAITNSPSPLGSRDVGKEHPEGNLGKRLSGSKSLDSRSLAIVQEHHVSNSGKNRNRVFHKISDITKGTENVKISLLDEIGTEGLPRFVYCPENISYESAYVHVSLARIADEYCCRKCRGDCLSSAIPCTCAHDTGGEYAYTPEGLLTEKFLKSCIAMKLEPRNEDLFYCQDCPLERAKSGGTHEKCKGHLLRKFIKECWRKCGCNMNCGNRVVQRGITRKLQVYLTSEGKGWGLRTLEELPEGAFVCEYVGEILTNIELYERNTKSNGNKKHVYPVLLDADWATEGVLKDEDALCLDATHYGNVARFINHRCIDGNIIEVPVQVETPDRHYYHLAFFTKKKVNALEELTWDYGIDFDDENHPIKAFQCVCGSQHCRGTKPPT